MPEKWIEVWEKLDICRKEVMRAHAVWLENKTAENRELFIKALREREAAAKEYDVEDKKYMEARIA
jgi:hypothetical protein